MKMLSILNLGISAFDFSHMTSVNRTIVKSIDSRVSVITAKSLQYSIIPV